MQSSEKILVIKLGAFGDFIQALGPMAAIRKHHPGAHITILTTPPFESFARDCGYADDVWLDTRPKILDITDWAKLKKKLSAGEFTRVYDLQNNDRTSFYFKLFSKKNRPEWVGIARGASHRNTSPARNAGHAFDGHVQTLALAGIQNIEIDKLDWLQAPLDDLGLKPPYVLLIPGSAPNRLEKRWPAAHYAALAQSLIKAGFQPVIIGGPNEQVIAAEILKTCPAALDLTGRTSFAQIASLARTAIAAIGNDTGPMHLIAVTGCACLVLFSKHSNPERHNPKGAHVEILRADHLQDLNLESVENALQPYLKLKA